MRPAISALVAVLVLTGCSSGEEADGPTPSTTVPTTTEAPAVTEPTEAPQSPYDRYVTLAGELGGDVIEQPDAATRAALLCQAGGAESFLGGVPITEFPTDLALVRAYCPEREANLA